MILTDTALAQRARDGNPIRVGMIGAGFMARAIALQFLSAAPGIRLAAISNRTIDNARAAYQDAGATGITEVASTQALERAIEKGTPAITDDARLLCRAGNIDVLVETTGAIEFGAQITLEAIANGKHLISMNAELDGTVGPLLKVKADAAGVILTACDGDQPGVEMNLWRYVKSMGLTPLVCGNVKGLQDPYRNPTTQQDFARRTGQKPHMVASFADGTKMTYEQAIVANGTGMRAAKRGMIGRDHPGHVDELTGIYDIDELQSLGGIVDYVVGAKPTPAVYVMGAITDPKQRELLKYYKLGDGPLYSFYTPYHLCHFEMPISVSRVVDFGDTVLAPLGAPVVEVVATAKTDLKAGQTLDGIGWYMTYGQAENSDVVRRERLLPMGAAEGCVLRRDIAKDQTLSYDDVTLPEGRLIDALLREQADYFA